MGGGPERGSPRAVRAALLAADMGIATAGFLVAYALCLDQGTLGDAWPPAALSRVALVWQLAYAAGDMA